MANLAMSSYYSDAGEVSVLIVDDDEVSREVLATVFTIEGYEVQTAPDGVAALAMLDAESYRPRVILMDVRMPGLRGASLISQLRERVRPESGTVLLAMSASEPHIDDVLGADGFLGKPFGAKELKQWLEKSPRAPAKPDKPGAPTTQVTDYTSEKPADTPVAEDVVLDRNKLAALRALMPEAAVRQIYTTAVDDLSRRMPTLEAAIERGDSKMVHHIGHGIKGGCGMVGAVNAARLGAKLEAESDKLDNSGAIAAQLSSAIEALKDMLGREFSPQ
ncbi:response regulator [Terracidiphilus gabretensis]|uniref:response regulator n=1 Tax=Terracidiphilus gabretensis TaxID=1577687 RepID=UPI00071B0256|nr:response regulator [Terracidiphilus gabretensis]